jgi:hypothetical protein
VEILMGGPFDEARVTKNVEAGEWLAAAIRNLEPPSLDKSYGSMRAVGSKQISVDEFQFQFIRGFCRRSHGIGLARQEHTLLVF